MAVVVEGWEGVFVVQNCDLMEKRRRKGSEWMAAVSSGLELGGWRRRRTRKRSRWLPFMPQTGNLKNDIYVLTT